MQDTSRLNREIWGSVAFVLSLFSVLSLISYSPLDRSLNAPSGNVDPLNWGGLVGAYLADVLLQGLGLTAFLIPIFLLLLSFHLFRREPRGPRLLGTLGYGAFLWGVTLLISLVHESHAAQASGGVLGGFSKEVLVALFGVGGAYVIAFFLLSLSAMLISQRSVSSWLEGFVQGGQWLYGKAASAVAQARARWQEERESKFENFKKKRRAYRAPPIVLQLEEPEESEKGKKKLKVQPEQFTLPAVSRGGYTLPSVAFLDPPPEQQTLIDRDTLEANSLVLQRKLSDFGIEGEVVAVRPGPVITMYEFRPAPGVMVKRIVGVADDLSMALSAVSIRILAPIPGESVVGIEIPNARREKVFLREIMQSDTYARSESKLTLALGKDISGAAFVADLARMPHLLVAGATGTGKSVAINAMILSILCKATPDDVRFIMIDPKMLELTPYEGLPHLLTPVVTEPKKAGAALFWATDEMDRRYRLMRDKGARNIDNYNRIIEREAPPGTEAGADGNGKRAAEAEGAGRSLEGGTLEHGRLPRIVIIIDELADLMMSVGRDIEEYIIRLAQKARAAGIHMVLATQRPSVDVITGLIKANFPARISFQVTSRVDSRTILDSMGAERLLGNGDLLFLPPGTARLCRLHGAYVSNREIRKITEFIKQQAKPTYLPDLTEMRRSAESPELDDTYDEMYDQAVKLVTDTGQASISMVQRRLRIGYNRAARMIEQMEKDGVIGPADGAKPREVYAQKVEG